MTRMLEGKVSLITGGARGIGRETALLFAEEGAKVVVSDLNIEGAEETVALINKQGGQALSKQCDVTNTEAVNTLVDFTINSFGKIDCAFNNAGIAPYQIGAQGKRTGDWSEDSVDKMLAINLKGVWACMAAELRAMSAAGNGGSIINTASIAGLAAILIQTLIGAISNPENLYSYFTQDCLSHDLLVFYNKIYFKHNIFKHQMKPISYTFYKKDYSIIKNYIKK